jgi:hypothetical protein
VTAGAPLSTIGITMPEDFPGGLHQAVFQRLHSHEPRHPTAWPQFSGAWIASAHRFKACVRHGSAFARSLKKYGTAPPHLERHNQEREIFNFFVSGFSSLESLYYALFAIGAALDDQAFPIATAEEQRKIYPKRVAEAFRARFPTDELGVELERLRVSQEFKDWGECRNVLAHRVAPRRMIYVDLGASVGQTHPGDWWRDLALDQQLIRRSRRWLAEALKTIMTQADTFTSENL